MLRAVLFDFHNTIAHADSLSGWVKEAARTTDAPQTANSDVVAVLRSVWSRAALRYPDSAWDLDPALHRTAFEEVLTEESTCSQALASALYDVMPSRWVAVDGAVDLLTTLDARGVRLAVVSNIAIDIRPRLDELGMLEHFTTVVLSYEVGLVKPDARIFERAVAALDVSPSECLMIGDSPTTDGGAVQAGISTVIIPVVRDRPQLTTVREMLRNTAV